eukprot:TRINITY_DN2788_c0_g1_i12.p1 TRINITY_DN2788_c0_g1~~TRINITY_DN2788_c0_g1_i12.p1  ORF type:complete len:225 (-),score=32.62 TRINITY_DN2788_c0_g1_i12:631-1305(-)
MLGKRFTSGVFSDSAVCTVGCEYHAKEVNRKGSTYNVQFWDTAGQEKFGHLSSPYYRSASGCLLVFSLTDARSFQRLNYWLGQLRQNVTNDNFVIVCVGNKSDLGYRDVQKNVIEGFCNREKVTGYVETSGSSGINAEYFFFFFFFFFFWGEIEDLLHLSELIHEKVRDSSSSTKSSTLLIRTTRIGTLRRSPYSVSQRHRIGLRNRVIGILSNMIVNLNNRIY